MRASIRHLILDYLRFDKQEPRGASSMLRVNESVWKRGLEFADVAGLTLHVRSQLIRRNDLDKLPKAIQNALEQRHHDNVRRTQTMIEEFVELNRQLRDASVRYLNLKGVFLVPDFVERLEQRIQYDYDFLVHTEDLQRAYRLFLAGSYCALHSTHELVADHWPTLIRKTGWKWRGNYFDPAIPLGVELHYQLWDSKFELLPIQVLEGVWERARPRAIASITAPTLAREDMLLYVTLHCFRHLLRNDLRLSHVYEIAFFLQQTFEQEAFWSDFTETVTRCPNTTKAVTTTFELARFLFRPALAQPVCHLLERLPAASRSWVDIYARAGAIHCFRNNRHALLLHLGLLESNAERRALLRQKLLPRHLPLPAYGVQIPTEERNFGFRVVEAAQYASLLARRSLFHLRSLAGLLLQLPLWLIQLGRGQGASTRR